MNGRESGRLREIGGQLGVTEGDIVEIRRKRAERRLRLGFGATIAAAVGAIEGYYIGLLSPVQSDQSSYPLCIIPLAATAAPWPIRQARLVRRNRMGVTLAGLAILLTGLVAFLIAYALGVSRAASPTTGGILYGVTHR